MTIGGPVLHEQSLDTQLDWPTWLASINLLQIAVVICALYVIGRLLMRFWPWLRKAMLLIDSLGALPAYMERTDKQIAEIHHETAYNNETSMKDAVRRVELGVKGLYDRVDELSASDEQMRRDIEDTRPNLALPQLPKENP